MEYIAYLHKEKNSVFGVSFPDLPGCVAAGKTLEEARKLAVEALSICQQAYSFPYGNKGNVLSFFC